jgi:hypothetical protein
MLGGTVGRAERCQPLIDEQDGMGAWRNLCGDFGQMEIHRLGVATRRDERCTLALLRADRAEDGGGGGSLIFRGARA